MVECLQPHHNMDETPARRTNEEAARWVVRLDAGPLSPDEQRELDAWLEAAPHHRGALVRARAAWVDLDRIGALASSSTPVDAFAGGSTPVHVSADSGVSHPRSPRQERDNTLPLSSSGERVGVRVHFLSRLRERAGVRGNRRWLLAASIAGLAVLGATWLALNIGRDVYESGIGEVRRVTLADGSSMVLNTATKAIVHFSDTRREVRLERGEALFQVQKDASRPFIVWIEDLAVKAVGTAFAVRIAGARVDVTVTEGVVEVAHAAGRGPSTQPVEQPKRVAANQRAIVRAAGAVSIEPIEPEVTERRLAWRGGMVAFDGESLNEAVEEINRHSRRQIVVDDAALSARPVVGIFRASDVEGFAQAAATALGAEVAEEDDVIHLRPAEAR